MKTMVKQAPSLLCIPHVGDRVKAQPRGWKSPDTGTVTRLVDSDMFVFACDADGQTYWLENIDIVEVVKPATD